MSERRPPAFLRIPATLLAVLITAGLVAAQPLPDPTRPPEAWQAPSPGIEPIREEDWTLRSILVAPSRRVAVINGRAYQEGDHVDNAILVTIHPTAVTLRKDGRTFTVRLAGGRTEGSGPAASGGKPQP